MTAKADEGAFQARYPDECGVPLGTVNGETLFCNAQAGHYGDHSHTWRGALHCEPGGAQGVGTGAQKRARSPAWVPLAIVFGIGACLASYVLGESNGIRWTRDLYRPDLQRAFLTPAPPGSDLVAVVSGLDVRDFGVATGNESAALWAAMEAAHASKPDVLCAPSHIWARSLCKRSPMECAMAPGTFQEVAPGDAPQAPSEQSNPGPQEGRE